LASFLRGIIDKAIKEWRVQLKACFRENNGHVKHKVQDHNFGSNVRYE